MDFLDLKALIIVAIPIFPFPARAVARWTQAEKDNAGRPCAHDMMIGAGS